MCCGGRNFLFFIAIVASKYNAVLSGSCREANLCCTGRDSSCVVQKAPINAIIEDLSDKPCYCDHACLKLGDCCTDFKDACGGKYINIDCCKFFTISNYNHIWPRHCQMLNLSQLL